MYHHDRSLVIVLIIALFSLASLQGLSLVLKTQSNVLGETSTIYKCCSNPQCLGDCSYRTIPCTGGTFQCNAANTPTSVSYITPPPITVTPTPQAPYYGGNIPCSVITQIQAQYCQNLIQPTVTPTKTITPLPITPTRVPTGIGTSTTPTPRLPTSTPTRLLTPTPRLNTTQPVNAL